MTIFVGIDPGADGGIAFLSNTESIYVEAHAAIIGALARRDILLQYNAADLRVCIEESRAFPEQNSVATFSQAMDYSQWLTILEVYKIPHQIVPVAAWHKVMMIGKPSPPARPKLPKAGTIPPDERKELKTVHDRAVRDHKQNI